MVGSGFLDIYPEPRIRARTVETVRSSWEPHFFQQFGAPWIRQKTFHQRAGFHFWRARVALPIGAFEPLKCLINFSAISVDLANLKSRVILVCGDELLQRLVGILCAALRVISQRFTRQSLPLPLLLLRLRESLFVAPFREQNLAPSHVQSRKVRIHFFSLLQRGQCFIIAALVEQLVS